MPIQRIFVGDVQGCADELESVLERARAELGERVELWCVGDLVNRGPASLRVLRLVRALEDAGRARVVLGNHDLALLAVCAGARALRPGDTLGEVLADPARDAWVDWLRTRPLVVRGRMGEQDFAMVHASVHPDWDLAALEAWGRRIEARLAAPDRREALAFLAGDGGEDRQARAERDALGRITSARSVTADGAWSADYPGPGRPAWHREWRARQRDYGVVYGHWARQGLHVEPRLRGLDTGCVHGGPGTTGALTAWLPRPDASAPFDVPDDRFWSVPARRAYYRAAAAPPPSVRKKGD